MSDFNPIAAMRQRYPGVNSWTDAQIAQQLSDPAKFRSAFPEYDYISDADIQHNLGRLLQAGSPAPNVGASVAARARQVPSTIGAMGQGIAGGEAQKVADNPAHLLQALGPAAAIAAVPLTGGTSLLPAVAAAGLAGMGGEAINQTAQAALGTEEAPTSSPEAFLRSLGTGAVQGAAELGGRVLAKPLQWLLTGPLGAALKDNANKAVYELNRLRDLHMTAPEIDATTPAGKVLGAIQRMVGESGLLGRPVAAAEQAAGQESGQRAIQQTLDQLAPTGTPQATGRAVEAAARTGSSSMHREAAEMYPQLYADAQAVKARVNLQPVKDAINADLDAHVSKSYVPGATITDIPGSVRELYTNILNAPPSVTLQQANALRQGLRDYQPKPDDLFRDKASATASHLYGQLTGAINSSLPPDLAARFTAINQFYKQGADLFDRSKLADLEHTLQVEPERVIQQIGDGAISKVQAVKQALLGYQRMMTPAERSANQAAWQRFQRSFAEQKLLNAGVGQPSDLLNLKDRMGKMGQQTLNEVFSDPQGRVALSNMQQLGEAFSRIQALPGGNAMQVSRALRYAEIFVLAGAGLHSMGALGEATAGLAAFEGTPAALLKVMYNPTAARLMLRGVAGMAQESSLPAARAIGSMAASASSYTGAAMADLIRAFQIAQIGGEAFPASLAPTLPTQGIPAIPGQGRLPQR